MSVLSRSYNGANNLSKNSIYDDLTLNDIKYIKTIEKRLFNCDFENEDLSMRLDRLEVKLFNMKSSGNYSERLYRINNALNNSYGQSTYTTYYSPINTHYPIVNRNYYPYGNFRHHQESIYQNKIRNIRNFVRGNMTGYTIPPVQNYSNYNNFSNIFSDNNNSDYYLDNGRYYNKNHATDGGVGVTIISD